MWGDNYPDTPHQLRNARNDAVCMARYLREERQWDAADVRALLNKDATKANILDSLTWAREANEPGGVMVVFNSGHGTLLPSDVEPDGTMECIVPYDFNPERPESLLRDVDMADFIRTLCPMVHCFIINDACFSGGADSDRSIKRARFIPNPLRPRCVGRVRSLIPDERPLAYMAACRANQTADDGKGDNGAFTGAMLEVLANGLVIPTPAALVVAVSQLLATDGYDQEPQLTGGLGNVLLAE